MFNAGHSAYAKKAFGPSLSPRDLITKRAYDGIRYKKANTAQYLHARKATIRYETSLPRPPKRAWEPWEKKFVTDYPFHGAREIAFALGRSIRGIIELRKDPTGQKRVARTRRATRHTKPKLVRTK